MPIRVLGIRLAIQPSGAEGEGAISTSRIRSVLYILVAVLGDANALRRVG
jgi:hypothetical protein